VRIICSVAESNAGEITGAGTGTQFFVRSYPVLQSKVTHGQFESK
jgi:hypothetical protein